MTPVGTAVRRFGITAREALAVVGRRVDEVHAAVASHLDGGEPYLVGSLASGLGNERSDVDVHVFRPGMKGPDGPHLCYAGETLVDVERFPADRPGEMESAYRSASTVEAPFGRVALVEPPDQRTGNRLARWLHAVPLRTQAAPLFSDDSLLLAVLVRAAFEDTVRGVALARLATAAGLSPPSSRFLWQAAYRCLLELWCRARGDVTPGEKWLGCRVRRLAGDASTVVWDEAGFRTAAGPVGYPGIDEWAVVNLRRSAGLRQVSLGDRAFYVTARRRVLATVCDLTGPLAWVAGADQASVFHAVRRGEVDLVVDRVGLEAVLCGDREAK